MGTLYLWGLPLCVLLAVQMGKERQRDPERGVVKRGSRVQSTFDNRLRDRHQNEITLVNLFSINYLRNGLQ